jgi:TolB protein
VSVAVRRGGLAAVASALALLAACTSMPGPAASVSPAACRSPSVAAAAGPAASGPGRLAFASAAEPGGQLDLFVARGDGADAVAIASSRKAEYTPTWSPDGAELAFRVNRPGPYAPDIWVANADGSDARNLTVTPDDTEWSPAWSPDGSRIAYYFGANGVGGGDLYAMRPDGSDATNLTNESPGGGANEYPAWSPDSAWIAYIHYTQEGNFEIWAMRADGSCAVDLTNDEHADEWPAWSPDGRSIAFMSDRDGNFGAGDIFVMAPDGSSPTNLTRTRRVNESFPAWTPDGRIGFVRYAGRAVSGPNEQSAAEIWVMDADGSNAEPLGVSGYELGPMAWTPVS